MSRGRSFPLASTTARLSRDSRGSLQDAGAPLLSLRSSGGSCSEGLGAAGGVISGDDGSGVARSSGIDISDGVAEPCTHIHEEADIVRNHHFSSRGK
jgi:hypothetical protein